MIKNVYHTRNHIETPIIKIKSYLNGSMTWHDGQIAKKYLLNVNLPISSHAKGLNAKNIYETK